MMEEKSLSQEAVFFQMLEFETSKSDSEVLKSNSNILVRNNFSLKIDFAKSEEDSSHNALYFQQLSIARYQVFMLTNILSSYQ